MSEPDRVHDPRWHPRHENRGRNHDTSRNTQRLPDGLGPDSVFSSEMLEREGGAKGKEKALPGVSRRGMPGIRRPSVADNTRSPLSVDFAHPCRVKARRPRKKYSTRAFRKSKYSPQTADFLGPRLDTTGYKSQVTTQATSGLGGFLSSCLVPRRDPPPARFARPSRDGIGDASTSRRRSAWRPGRGARAFLRIRPLVGMMIFIIGLPPYWLGPSCPESAAQVPGAAV